MKHSFFIMIVKKTGTNQEHFIPHMPKPTKLTQLYNVSYETL